MPRKRIKTGPKIPGAPKGHPKWGGRQKGTPNKRTQELADFYDSKGVFIPEIILDKLPLLNEERQVSVLLELMQYLYPKRKAVQHSGSIGTGLADKMKWAEERLKEEDDES